MDAFWFGFWFTAGGGCAFFVASVIGRCFESLFTRKPTGEKGGK